MRSARREAALPFDDEHLDLFGARELQRDRLAGGGRHAVPRGSRVPLEEESLPLHLRVAGKASAPPQVQQIRGEQRPAPAVGEGEARIAAGRVPAPHDLVERREARVDERHRVPGGQDEPVAEGTPGAEEIDAHRPRQERGDEGVHLRARAAGMPRLPVVEHEVDALVHEVLDDLPARELALGGGEEGIDGRGCRYGLAHRVFFFMKSRMRSRPASIASNDDA